MSQVWIGNGINFESTMKNKFLIRNGTIFESEMDSVLGQKWNQNRIRIYTEMIPKWMQELSPTYTNPGPDSEFGSGFAPEMTQK